MGPMWGLNLESVHLFILLAKHVWIEERQLNIFFLFFFEEL